MRLNRIASLYPPFPTALLPPIFRESAKPSLPLATCWRCTAVSLLTQKSTSRFGALTSDCSLLRRNWID
jgi:hypothetical protein